MRALTSVIDAIGQTRIVRLRHVVPDDSADVWLKLEYENPTGSMKDRMALAMVEGAEIDRRLQPGGSGSSRAHRRVRTSPRRFGSRADSGRATRWSRSPATAE